MPDPISAGNGALSLAAAALRRGVWMLSRSFRLHRPRGAFCHRGWCQQCRVTLGDGRVVLACQTDEATSAPLVRPRRYGRLAGLLAEAAPPWFYEQRFLRPRRLRQFYLERLRRLSAAPSLPPAIPAAATAFEDLACTSLVVGGGLAGLAAAKSLALAGRRVVLVEAERLGGSARWIPGPATRVQAAVDAARAAGVDCREGMLCAGLYDDPDRALCVGAHGTLVIRFETMVLATGAYDQLPTIPGNDLPGIIGMRAFERLAAQRALPSNVRIGIYGHRLETERALAAATASGRDIDWIAGPGELPDAPLRRNAGATLVRVWGRGRVGSVEFAPGGRVECDLLVIALSQATYELQAQLGFPPRLAGEPAVPLPGVVARRRLLVVGEAAGEYDVARAGAVASAAVDAWIGKDRVAVDRGPGVASGREQIQAVVSKPAADDAFLCLCEDVRVRDVRAAIADGYRDVELIKRHTGAGTGPCQGKLCHVALSRCLAESGLDVRLPTARPLVRPVPLACFAGRPDE